MRKFLLTAGLLTSLALAQSGPITTFDCAIYGTNVNIGKNAQVTTAGGNSVSNQAGGVNVNRNTGQVSVGNEGGSVVVNPDGTVNIGGKGGNVKVNPDGSVNIGGDGGNVNVNADNVQINPGSSGGTVSTSGPVQQGDRILPATEPCHLSPSGPSHSLAKSQDIYLKPGSYGTLEGRNSARFTLAPGEYRIENLLLHNSTDFELEGPVVLYIGKTLSVTNSAELNSERRPADLVVYQAEPNRPVSVVVANSALAKMAFCGPTASVRVANNGEVYGSLIAQNVQLDQQARVFYDPALRSVKIRR